MYIEINYLGISLFFALLHITPTLVYIRVPLATVAMPVPGCNRLEPITSPAPRSHDQLTSAVGNCITSTAQAASTSSTQCRQSNQQTFSSATYTPAPCRMEILINAHDKVPNLHVKYSSWEHQPCPFPPQEKLRKRRGGNVMKRRCPFITQNKLYQDTYPNVREYKNY